MVDIRKPLSVRPLFDYDKEYYNPSGSRQSSFGPGIWPHNFAFKVFNNNIHLFVLVNISMKLA